MKKILVLGSNGMVGHVTKNHLLKSGYEVPVITRESYMDAGRYDIINDRKLYKNLKKIKPDVIVNCTGILINESNTNPERAITVNSLLPRILSIIAKELDIKFMHLSTDCVFSGMHGPYSETDHTDAKDIYGKTKSLGELDNDRDLTIRTSFVGPQTRYNSVGLFDWVMKSEGEIKGYTKVLWSGLTTLEAAKAIQYYIEKPTIGIINLTNGMPISKFDLLKLIIDVWGLENVTLTRNSDVSYDKSLISNRKSELYEVPPYKTMFEDLKKYMDANRTLYKRYY